MRIRIRTIPAATPHVTVLAPFKVGGIVSAVPATGGDTTDFAPNGGETSFLAIEESRLLGQKLVLSQYAFIPKVCHSS